MNFSESDLDKFYRHMPQEEFNYTVNISENNSYIYFETAKVACSTIKKTLQDLEIELAGLAPMPDFRNVHFKGISPLKSPFSIGVDQFFALLNDTKILKFSFVRNPFSRVLSAYLDKITKNTPEREKFIKRFNFDANSEITLIEFLECIKDTPPKEMDHHWRPQSYQLFFDLIDYDFIGRFENFTNDFEIILGEIFSLKSSDSLEIKRYSPHATQADNRLNNFYTDYAVKLVQDIYFKDFSDFGYDKNLPEVNDKCIDESYLDHFEQGEYLMKNGNIKQAISAFKYSIDLNHNFCWAHHCLGNALFWDDQLDEAVKAYQKAIDLKPDLVASYRQLEKIFTKTNRVSEAARVHEIAKKIEQQRLST